MFWLNLNILFLSFSVKDSQDKYWHTISFICFSLEIKTRTIFFWGYWKINFFPLSFLKLMQLHEVFWIYKEGFVRQCLCQYFLVCKSTLKRPEQVSPVLPRQHCWASSKLICRKRGKLWVGWVFRTVYLLTLCESHSLIVPIVLPFCFLYLVLKITPCKRKSFRKLKLCPH